ncbi:MAG TPA: helix-turn-helix domain-containing protein [Micropepsaceae bacterium]|nr:helix-turn-helix domain-containing protein [Micropepsaceae bacterium]
MPRTIFRSADREPSALSATVARNIRRLRFRAGLTIERLAQLADVNLLTVDQMENGKGEPTLALAWKIANALDVPFAALMAEHAPGGTVITRKDRAKVIVSENLGVASRALFPFDEDARVEFYELRVAPDHYETSQAHAAGTREMLHVAEGALEVIVGREPPYRVNKGDTIQFQADLPHSYRNLTALPATAYLVMTYQ